MAVLSKDPEDPVLRWIEQIQGGIRVDENFEKLFLHFRPRVRSYFFRKGFTAEECKDLTQDAFLRVFNGIDTFRRESRFERWFWEIVIHVYFNEVRKLKTEKRRAVEKSLDAPGSDRDDPAPALEIPADEQSPEEHMIWRERVRSLRSALHDLPNQMRRCCILRYEKGLKYQEIATLMKISIETVKAHLFQARRRLLARLGEEGEVGKKRGAGP